MGCVELMWGGPCWPLRILGKTLTHYWHLCVWGVKCYITQRSEKSKPLEAGKEREGERKRERERGEEPFYLSRMKLKVLVKMRKCIVFCLSDLEMCEEYSCEENPRGKESSCVMCRCFMCVWQNSSRNDENMLCEYEKVVSLFIISTHIFKYTYLHLLYNEYISCV